MRTDRIITIGRQYGSGGLEIGKRLAERLEIPCYDREILELAARKSGLSENVIRTYDEKPRSLLFTAATDPYSFGLLSAGIDESVENKAINASMKAIWDIESNGPCVIVGRAADYFLKESQNALKVFIYASLEARIKTVMERDGLPEDKAKKRIQQIDKKRAAYYNFYTMKQWGDMTSYDICIDSSRNGYDKTVDILEKIALK